MIDRKKLIEQLETDAMATNTGYVEVPLFQFSEILALLKEQETTSTGKTRIFQCKKCGYGIDDIYLSNEHDFDIYPHFCPNCGRSVK